MADRKVVDAFDDKLPPVTDDVSEEQQEDTIKINTAEQAPRDDIEKVESVSRRSDIAPGSEPPDGGLNAWLKVFGCFLLYSNVW